MKIALLKDKDIKKLPKEILTCKIPNNYRGSVQQGACFWWVESSQENKLAYITCNGDLVYKHKDDGNIVHFGFRPCIIFDDYTNIELKRKTKKGNVKFLGTKWIDISNEVGYPCLLKKTCLKETRVYQEDVKVYLAKWAYKKNHKEKA